MATSIDPSAILAQLTEGYLKLPLIQKILFPILIIASVSGIIFVSQWANRPDYTVLFSDLEPADSAAVIERLKQQKISYEVRADGRTVAVSPPEIVHELRINLAGEGVPKGGKVGFEIFDSNNLGATSFVEKLKFLRAIQGELERTISAVDAVSSVRVHVTQPEKSVFAKQGSVPTASVMLKLRAGGELDKKQIKGITNLVAGSVEGLKAENVSIVDTFGNLLTPKEEEGDMLGVEATQIQYQHEVERSYIQRIEQMLSKVLGPGKVVARVTADLDFSSNEREEESFDPSGQVIRSERSVQEGTAGGAQRGGVPGVVSNLTNDPNLLSAPEGGTEGGSRKESVKNYEVSRAVVKSSSPRGKLTRLSVAVLVDGTYEAAAAAGEAAAAAAAAPQKVFKALAPEVLTQIESLVRSAVGFDSVRGDTMTVENIPFYSQDGEIAQALDQKVQQDFIFNLVSYGGTCLFVLLFFFVVVKPMMKLVTAPTDAELDLERLLPTGLVELERELEQERAKVKAEIPNIEPTIDIEQLEELIAENSRIVKDNPTQAALLIRYWLNDGRL